MVDFHVCRSAIAPTASWPHMSSNCHARIYALPFDAVRDVTEPGFGCQLSMLQAVVVWGARTHACPNFDNHF